MIEKPQIIETTAQQVAYIHIETPRSEIPRVMGPGISEVMAAVRAQGIDPAGSWFAHHLKMTPEVFCFDICVPVPAPFNAVGRVKSGQCPALKRIRTVYNGSYEGLFSAWREFDAWVDANGLKTGEDLYECYLLGPESSANPADWRTELSRPLIE